MSRFTSFAEKANGIAKDAIAKYSKAEKNYESALALCKKYPQRQGMVNAEYAAKAARANADRQEAELLLKAALREMEEAKKGIAEVRRELSAEVYDYFRADPAEVDVSTVELLKSGILKPAEYATLAENARKNKNFTTARIVARYAEEAAEAAHKRGLEDDASTLRGAAILGNQDSGEPIMKSFDAIMTTYSMTCENPAMAGKWDELTGPLIANI